MINVDVRDYSEYNDGMVYINPPVTYSADQGSLIDGQSHDGTWQKCNDVEIFQIHQTS